MENARAGNAPLQSGKRKKSFIEDLDFFAALEATKRRMDRNSYRNIQDYRRALNSFDYIGRSLYCDKIKEYFDCFGRENVHIIVKEENFGPRTPFTLALLFRFISLFDDEAIRITMQGYEKFHFKSSCPSSVAVDYDGVTLTVRADRQINTRFENPDPQTLELAHDLNNKQNFKLTSQQKKEVFNQYFKDDVAALESLLGRDLSHWKP